MTRMDPSPSFPPGRTLRIGVPVALGALAAVVLVGLVNHLATTRLRWRRDLTRLDRFSLSPLTRQVLARLTNEVRVTVLFDREAPLFSHVDGLLRQYADEQPRIRLRVVDYNTDPNTALLLKATYPLGANADNVVIFDNGSQPARVVSDGELSVYDADVGALMAGERREIRRSGFKGELLFTSTLATLAESAPALACFLSGHGEQRPDGEDQLFGCRGLARLLATKGVEIRTARLDGTNQVPAGCELLVIAGPTEPFTAREAEKLEAHLNAGGRLLLLLHPYAVKVNLGLDRLLLAWGIQTPPWYAGDEQNTKSRLDVYTSNFGSHPITTPLHRSQGRVYFPLPRVVSRIPPALLPADAPKAEVLAATSAAGLTRSDIRNDSIAFQPGVDQRGEIPLAVAAEKGGVSGVTTGRGTGRLVVVGDVSAFGNEVLPSYRNAAFAELAAAWLLDKSQLLAIGPRPLQEYRLELTPAQVRTLQALLLAGLPGSVLLLGLGIWFRRRS